MAGQQQKPCLLMGGWKATCTSTTTPPLFALTSKKWVPQGSLFFNAWFFPMLSLLLSQNGLGVSGNERLGQGQGYVPLQKSTPGTMAKTNVEQIPGLKPLVSVLINTNWTRIRCDYRNQFQNWNLSRIGHEIRLSVIILYETGFRIKIFERRKRLQPEAK